MTENVLAEKILRGSSFFSRRWQFVSHSPSRGHLPACHLVFFFIYFRNKFCILILLVQIFFFFLILKSRIRKIILFFSEDAARLPSISSSHSFVSLFRFCINIHRYRLHTELEVPGTLYNVRSCRIDRNIGSILISVIFNYVCLLKRKCSLANAGNFIRGDSITAHIPVTVNYTLYETRSVVTNIQFDSPPIVEMPDLRDRYITHKVLAIIYIDVLRGVRLDL